MWQRDGRKLWQNKLDLTNSKLPQMHNCNQMITNLSHAAEKILPPNIGPAVHRFGEDGHL